MKCQACIAAGQPLQQVLLENVDRLIASPSACPGRDFAIILASLQSLGYGVSWQVINSGEYGFAQRRKRVFIVAVHQSTAQFQRLKQATAGDLSRLLVDATPLAQAFPRGFTMLEGVNGIARARLMGNALITGIVACIAAAMVD
jgi:DNA (cytosine-5)-methyltransferase 1